MKRPHLISPMSLGLGTLAEALLEVGHSMGDGEAADGGRPRSRDTQEKM